MSDKNIKEQLASLDKMLMAGQGAMESDMRKALSLFERASVLAAPLLFRLEIAAHRPFLMEFSCSDITRFLVRYIPRTQQRRER